MIYNIISLILCIIIPLLFIRKNLNNTNEGFKQWITNNSCEIIIYFILVIGFGIRMINIQNLPNGLNCDEASSGYEAYSIANYGIDRNGNSVPVFLLSWGSGQNALYSYMIMPLMKLFGLSVLTTRLPMAILGCVSLIIMYKLLWKIGNKKLAIVGLAFFAICPWHIMKSRWGLESNVFPDLVLIATFFIIRGIQQKKISNVYIGFGVLGMCAYSYGTSYFFLPLFVIPLLAYLIYKKELRWKQAVICLSIVFVISLPIILYVIINTFDLPQIKILCFTIPRMTSNRYEEISSIFGSDFLTASLKNFKESAKVLLLQGDKLGWNYIEPYGITYLYSLPLTIIGIIENFKKRTIEKNIMNIWFMAAFLLMFVCEPNINRLNIIMIPIIYYTIIGLYEIINQMPKICWIIAAIYAVSFVMFIHTYVNTNFDKYSVFTDNIEDVIEYVDTLEADTIYIQYSYKEPYIYTLFYTQENPWDFIETVKYKKDGVVNFENIKSYGKYNFYLPEEIEHEDGRVYVIAKNNNIEINYEEWKITEFEKFIVLENK